MKVGFIYKITSPNKRVYIGQTVNLRRRKNAYSKLICSSQPLIFRSIKKYGWEKHKFDVLTECDRMDLNKWERYYQDLYNSMGKNGLNCCLTGYGDRIQVPSEETNLKRSLKTKGRKMPEWVNEKNRLAHLGQPAWNKGIKRTLKEIEAIRAGRNGNYLAEKSPLSKLILNMETGIYYYGCNDAARSTIRMSESYISSRILNKVKNNTPFLRV